MFVTADILMHEKSEARTRSDARNPLLCTSIQRPPDSETTVAVVVVVLLCRTRGNNGVYPRVVSNAHNTALVSTMRSVSVHLIIKFARTAMFRGSRA